MSIGYGSCALVPIPLPSLRSVPDARDPAGGGRDLMLDFLGLIGLGVAFLIVRHALRMRAVLREDAETIAIIRDNAAPEERAQMALGYAVSAASRGWQGPKEGKLWESRLRSTINIFARRLNVAPGQVIASMQATLEQMDLEKTAAFGGVSPQALKEAESLLAQYGSVLESREGLLSARSELPAEPKQIKESIRFLVRCHLRAGSLDNDYLIALRESYALLASFVSPAAAERHLLWSRAIAGGLGDRSREEVHAAAKRVVSAGQVSDEERAWPQAADSLRQEFDAFFNRLLAELQEEARDNE